MATYSRDTVSPVKPANIPASDWAFMPDTDKAKADVVMVGNPKIINTDPNINVINPPEIQSFPVVPQAKGDANKTVIEDVDGGFGV